MTLIGIGDEAGNTIQTQIAAAKELGWKHLEMRGVEVPGYPKANFHDIPEAAFDVAVGKLEQAGVGVYCFGSTVMNWAKTLETPFEVTLAARILIEEHKLYPRVLAALTEGRVTVDGRRVRVKPRP